MLKEPKRIIAEEPIIEEHLDENDMTYRYFREYNQANPMHQMSAPVGVGYVYAVKR